MTVDTTGPMIQPLQTPLPRRILDARRVFQFLIIAIGVAITLGALWSAWGPNPLSTRLLGISNVSPERLPASQTVTLTTGGSFTPRAAVLATGGSVTFYNGTRDRVDLRSAALSPSAFFISLPARARATVRFTRPGLYHYYDSLTARPLHVVANNEVIQNITGSGAQLETGSPAREGWVAVLPAPPGLQAQLSVPSGQDLFAPKALVTVVGSSIVVSNHDQDAHNFVIDPASPSGAAFMLDGTDAEPPSGWQRVLVVQQAGLYHVYCTMHTQVIRVVDGWHVVTPRPKASGYRDHNPMEAWIIALPVTTT
jgi:plastocyanin